MTSFTFDHVHGPSISEVTETSAIIWYRDDQGIKTPPQITYWSAKDKNETAGEEATTTTLTVQVDPTADFTSNTKLSNLSPDTVYEFKVGSREGSFKTPGSAACSFVFGSCIAGQGYGRNAAGHADGEGFPIFEKITDLQPDFFLLNGDSIYADASIEVESNNPWNKGERYVTQNGVKIMSACDNLESMRDRYKYHLEDPKLAKFLTRCPVYTNWDDHEVCDNFGQELLRQQGKGQLFDDGRQAFLEYWAREKPKEEPTRMYRSFTWGPHVEMFILDSRSHRDVHKHKGDNKTPTMEFILGDTQLKWLLEGLTASKSTWKFLATSIPMSFPTGWPTPEVDGYDGWADGKSGKLGGPEKELFKIFEHIHYHDIQNVVCLGGDVHYPYAISYDPFQSGKPLTYELAATPFHALCIPPPIGGPDDTFNPTVLFAQGTFGGKNFNFGQISIEDDGKFEFVIRNIKGASIYELKLRPDAVEVEQKEGSSGLAFITQRDNELSSREAKKSKVLKAH
jgi:alkaline phosphatase D